KLEEIEDTSKISKAFVFSLIQSLWSVGILRNKGFVRISGNKEIVSDHSLLEILDRRFS
ncbi:10155_t:CDS:2, partial [Gigaspora margarita]